MVTGCAWLRRDCSACRGAWHGGECCMGYMLSLAAGGRRLGKAYPCRFAGSKKKKELSPMVMRSRECSGTAMLEGV